MTQEASYLTINETVQLAMSGVQLSQNSCEIFRRIKGFLEDLSGDTVTFATVTTQEDKRILLEGVQDFYRVTVARAIWGSYITYLQT